MRDSIALSPQNEHGIDSRIFAGSGSGMDVCVTEMDTSSCLEPERRNSFEITCFKLVMQEILKDAMAGCYKKEESFSIRG